MIESAKLKLINLHWQTENGTTDAQPCCKTNIINQCKYVRYAQIEHGQLGKLSVDR